MTNQAIIIYRYLTHADFFNINKPANTEKGGGGQSYIDFSTTRVPMRDWEKLLDGVIGVKRTQKTQGASWEFPVHSIGLKDAHQRALIYKRRATSFAVANQKLGTRASNRIAAWHPENEFPSPGDPGNPSQCPTGLLVMFIKSGGKIWAGWFINRAEERQPKFCSELRAAIGDLLMPIPDPGEKRRDREGVLTVKELDIAKLHSAKSIYEQNIFVDSATGENGHSDYATSPVKVARAISALIAEDEDPEGIPDYSLVKIRKRNTKAVDALKTLYGGICQITGKKFIFKKRGGEGYTEVHHLVPLGRGGADNPRNMIVISAHAHRMLHYATVEKIDLSKIQSLPDGSCKLKIRINGVEHFIKWHPRHASVITATPKKKVG